MHPESYVFFDETDVTGWENARPAAFTESGIVEIWRLHFPSFTSQLNQFYDILRPEEKSKSALFHHENDKHKFIIGKAALRILLGGYLNISPEMLEFAFGLYLKPVLNMGGKIPVHFNLSHSGDYILIAISDTQIGVDVEHYETGLNINEVKEIAFSEKEVSFMNEQSRPHHTFFQLWTRKEALLKATSTGLNNNIRYVPCLNGQHTVSSALLNNSRHWRVSNFKVDTHHIGSIAYLKDTRELRFKQFTTQSSQVFC